MSLSRGDTFINFLQKTLRIYLNNPRYVSANIHPLFSKSVASFEEVKSVKDQKNKVLIDVREPSELQETGVIPGSINIPLGEVESALKLPPKEFHSKFGRTKPDSSTEIIFSCKMGKRSADAQEIASKLGFTNIKNYTGGWLDWEEHIKAGK